MNGKEINLTGDDIIIKSNNFSVDKNGNMTCTNANIQGNITSDNAKITGGTIDITTVGSGDEVFHITDISGVQSFIGSESARIGYTGTFQGGVYLQGGAHGQSLVMATQVVQSSLENQKKNFEKFQNGLDVVKNTDIYKYNFKGQKDGDKKHIGFVIGDKYKYSSDITAIDENGKEIGVDNYSMISVAYKAIQEQQEIIEQQGQKIKELEEKINGNNP